MAEKDVSRFRHEYKYMIDLKQESILRVKAAGLLMPDPHTGEDGTYLIRSLYLDDINNSCLTDNLSGTDPRSKFRIRYYNSDRDNILLEKKSKIRGMCRKESCDITSEECETLIRGMTPDINDEMTETKKRFFTEIRMRGLMPKVIVTYERIPFVYSGGNVRITFDRKLTSSNELNRFLSGDYMERPVLAAGNSIMEVKWDEVMPRHIKDTLKLENLNWTAFSKYSMCRRFHL
jgi:hypothetical protein